MSATNATTTLTAGRRISWLRGRSERLLLLTGAVGVLHHADHVLRYDHSGWPFRPEVSPFTYSLLAYPVIALILALRAFPWARVWLLAATYVVVQVTHVLVEPPSHQYGTWALGYGTTPSGAHPVNLLGIASPTLGVAAAVVSVLLSVAIVSTLLSLVADARRASRP